MEEKNLGGGMGNSGEETETLIYQLGEAGL